MNPQQFNNMGGMGRGMPNMNMMQNMNMGGMGMNNMNQNMAQQKMPNSLQVIYQNLAHNQQNDGPLTGWRGTVSLQERAAQIKILFDSLRMLGSTVDTKRSLDIALAFERKQFMQSPTQEAYKHSIHEKLAGIRDQRQQQVATAANGMPTTSGPPVMNAFPQMGAANQNMNFPQQQGMQPSPMLPQMQQPPSMNPSQPHSQQVNAANAANQANRANPPPELTKEDNTWINTRAAEMAKSTPREQMSQIVESMNPQVRQSLTEKKIDPIIYHFRMKATKEFRMQQAQKSGQGQPQAMMGMNMPRMQTPNQNSALPGTQPNGTPFMNNIDQFRGQQEEGMRSQQEGQLVVPASNPAQNLPQNLNPTPEMMRRQQQVWAQQFRQQNPNASDQDMRQFVMQKYSQLQMNIQRARNQASQQPGQGQNVMQQQNRMNMLNQPVNQNNAHDSPVQNVARPQSRPQPVQMMSSGQPMQPQQQGVNLQSIQQNMQRLPPQLQQVLKQSPHAQWPTIVNDWKQRQARVQAQQAFNQQQMNQAAQMQRSASQQAQNQNLPQMQNSQFPGPSPMQTSLSLGTEQSNQMPAMTPAQVQQQNLNANAQMMRMQQQQQQQQQQHQQLAQPNAMGPQKPNLDAQMQHALLRETDNITAPDQFRQRFAQAYAQASQNIPQLQTWQDFKNFTRAQNQPRVRLEDVMRQQLIFAQRRRQVIANGGMPQMSQQNPSTLQAPGMTQQGSNMGTQPKQQQITPQDIQAARIAHPSWNNLGDQQVRDLLATQQSRPQKSQAASVQGQTQGVNAGQAQGNARPTPQQRPGAQAMQQSRPQTQNQNQAPTENKSLKRPNQDDVPESGITQPQNSNRPHPLNITSKEQFEQLTPADKEKYLAQRKQLETAAKVTSLTKEIFPQMKNTPRITNMDQNSRMKIINMLTEDTTKKMLARFDMFLVSFLQNESDQNLLRVLIQHRWHLMQQYTEESYKNKTYQPAEHFTLNADNLEKILKTVTMKFQQTLKNSASSRSGPQPTIPPLTKENLNTASQQAAQLQKSNKPAKPRDGPPPAPTGEKPPFQFPSDRAQGVPKYANSGLKPEDLKLPPKKKMRNDAGASPATPVQTQQPRPLLKCPSQGCTAQGFNTQAELDFHRNQVHKPEMEPVRDPVAFLKNSVLQAFNLDESMEPKKSFTGAGLMEKSTSQGAKTDSKGVAPAVMAGGLSQQANKDMLSHTQKTHQAVQQSQGTLQAAATYKDSWAESNFELDDLVNAFGPTESGDIIPMATDSQALLDRTYEAYMKTDDYKRVFGDPDSASSEGSSQKSKSPDQGSELSLPANERTQAQKSTGHDLYHVDFNMSGDQLPNLEGNFDDLFVGDATGDDWEQLDTEGSMSDWEKVEGEDGQQQQQSRHDDLDVDSWTREPGSAAEAPFPEQDLLQMLKEPTDWEAIYASGDPSLYAGGTMAWNAVGKEGAEMRRRLGWPVEGAAGQAATGKK